ncbi:MAG TPA: GDSL-type esterase/lipase family protein [Solirubrobacteraceae bacterium]|nr:GDSL-type esterase/lipase family protein [Solirubrobacteraceae bacterium]
MTSAAEPCRKGLVAVGDSISVGEGSMALGVTPLSWAQWLARALDLPFTCYAVNGATAADMLREQLPRVRADYDVATLYAGVNDARSPGWDPAAYARDLDALAAALAARATRLLLLTLPHDLGRPTCAPKPVEAGEIVRGVAARHGAVVADLSDFGGWTLVLPDVVHPTALGQLEMADRAARALGCETRPSALAPDHGAATLRYAPTHARMLWHDLVRRGNERVRRP